MATSFQPLPAPSSNASPPIRQGSLATMPTERPDAGPVTRRRASCVYATPSACRSSSSSTFPDTCPASDRSARGVLRRGAKLLHAFAAARVPRVTIHLRKAYGGAFIAMNSRALGASRVLTWPSAELGVINDTSAVGIIHHRALAVAYRAHADPLRCCLDCGLVDKVIPPPTTRRAIAEYLATVPSARGSLTNIPL